MTAVDRSVPVERDGDVTVAVSASADVANLASQSKYTARTQHVGAAQPLKLGCLETRCKRKARHGHTRLNKCVDYSAFFSPSQ